MKERNKSLIFCGRSIKKKSLILSIVALVEILAIMLVSTFAWIESVSSIKIYTKDNSVGVVEGALKQRVKLDTTSKTIDLTEYFRPSGGYHLVGASSADGNVVLFPEIKGGNTTNYRAGTINDKNVNYISFTIKTTSKVNLAFDEVPTITIGGTSLNPVDLSDDTDEELAEKEAMRRLVRFSVGDNDGNYRIFSFADEFTEDVVNAADGSTASTTVYPYSEFVKGNGRVAETTNGGFLSFNLWIQDPTGAKSSLYNDKSLKVSGLKLSMVYPFTVKAVSNDVIGNTGGNVAVGNGPFGATAVSYAAPGQSIILRAAASESDGYGFVGWSEDYVSSSSPGIIASTNNPMTYIVPNNVTSGTAVIYAKFKDTHTLYFKPEYKHSAISNTDSNGRYAAYIWGSSDGTLSREWYVMNYVSSGAYSGYYMAEYRGNATNVIFCYMNPSTTPWTNAGLNADKDATWSKRYLQTFDLVFPSALGDYSYVATARYTTAAVGSSVSESSMGSNKVLGYWEHSHARVSAEVSGDGGSVSAALYRSTTATTSVTPYSTAATYVDLDGRNYTVSDATYEHKVTLKAVPDSIHNFEGWYLNNDKISGAGAEYTVVSPENVVGTAVTTATYQAKFALKPSATINIYVSPRSNYNNYYVRLYDSSNNNVYTANTRGFKQADYDASTGFFKVSFTVYATGKYYAIISSDDNYANKYPANGGLEINVSSVGSSATVNKLIKNDGTLVDKGSYRCIWFCDGTDGNWIANAVNNNNRHIEIYGGSDQTMIRVNNTAWIWEFASLSNSYDLYFKDMNGSSQVNYWKATTVSGKNQYTATSGKGSNTAGDGHWDNN